MTSRRYQSSWHMLCTPHGVHSIPYVGSTVHGLILQLDLVLIQVPRLSTKYPIRALLLGKGKLP